MPHTKKHDTTWDMTVGKPAGLILRFSLPLMMGNILQQLYNLADSIIVGRYVGSNEFGGIGCTGSIQYLIFSLGYGMATGISILISMLFGAGEKKHLTRAIYNSFYILLACALLITVAGFCGSAWILSLLSTPEALFPHALTYLRITMLGSAASIFYCGIASMMRALGDSKTPLAILVFSCLANIALDLVLILVFHWGVVGAAAATVISQFLSALLSYLCARRSLPPFCPFPGCFQPDLLLIRRSLRLGLPMALQNMMIASSCMVLQAVVNGFGALVVTATTAIGKIEQLVIQPFDSLSIGLSSFTGQNIGAKKSARVRQGFRFGLCYIAVISALILVIVQMFGSEILSVFVQDPEIISLGARALSLTSFFYFFLGLIYVARGILSGAGDTVYAAMNGIVELGCRILFATQLVRIPGLGVWACFLCTGLTWTVTGLLSLARYLTRRF